MIRALLPLAGLLAEVLALALLAALLAAGFRPAAATLQFTGGPVPDRRICAEYWHTAVHGGYVVRNAYSAADPGQCVTIRAGGANFTVTRSRAANPGSKVQAYPNIFYGCEWGVCSPRTRLPMRLSRVYKPVTSWRIRARAAGIWDAGYDLWFTRHRETNGKADGAELMIWAAARGVAFSGHHVVRIDGQDWYYASWPTRHDGGAWQYIQFRRVHAAARLPRLRLAPFIRFAEVHRAMSRRWWLESAEAGFEIWRGGRGLATRSFSFSLGRRAAPFPISVPPDHRPGGKP